MREWRRTIDSIDGRIQAAVTEGLFTAGAEMSIVVADGFDDGAEFVEVVTAWQGTRIPAAVARRAGSTDAPVQVLQDVRLKLFHALAND